MLRRWVPRKMCGICGIFDYAGGKPVEEDLVKGMCDVMVHRGPDAEGQHVEGKIGLGHRRLSIIDLSEKGRQPMSNEDGSVWISYNGEVYNFMELRAELEAKGYKFKSNTDTEVVLHLYEEEGIDCVKRLRGMFAFAIWDSKKETLYLARDRVGQKPLFYADIDGKMVFASEINAILSLPDFERKINLEALHYYLTHVYFYVPHPHTLFEGIRKLAPAHYMIVDKNGSRIERYWSIDYSKKRKGSEKEFIGEYKKLLKETVVMRQISDVPLGVLLSGGIDSSSIVSVMARSPGKGLKSFSIGFDAKDQELSRARLVSDKFNTENFELVFKPQDVKLLPEVIYHLGEPINLLPGLYSLALSNKIREEDVTVVLAGNGADELFGGYDYHNNLRFIDVLLKVSKFFPKKIFGALSNLAGKDSKAKTLLSLLATPPDKRKGDVYRRKAKCLKASLYSRKMRDAVEGVDAGKPLDDVFNEQKNASYFDRMLYTELFMGNMHSTVVIADVCGMMNSIEIRAPFLDHVMVEFAASLPVAMKVPSMLDRSRNKFVMKEAMAGVLPDEILSAKKMGFGYNIDWASWLKGEWKSLAEEILLNRSLPETGLFDMDSISRLISEHARGVKDHSTLLWGLITFELWYEIYFRGASPDSVLSEKING